MYAIDKHTFQLSLENKDFYIKTLEKLLNIPNRKNL